MVDFDGNGVIDLILDCGEYLLLRYEDGCIMLEADPFGDKIPVDGITYFPLVLPWRPTVSPEEALRLACAYWGGVVDGREDYGTGKVYKTRIVLHEAPTDDARLYRVIQRMETSHRIDYTEVELGTAVTHIQIVAILWVDAFTGECFASPPNDEGK